ncbi:MAG: flippase [Oscillospiraceae bacterium]|nr:flippase [Oscillospiraceae bacterium]
MNKAVKNTFWIVACKVLQMILSLVVSMLTARYLGPANYGLINYAASITAFVVPVMQLGLRSTLVQELVNAPEEEGKILGTAVMLNLVSALCCVVGIVSVVSVVNAGEQQTILICGLYSISLLFQAVEIIQYWFQAKLLSKYPSMAMLASYILVSGYKIWLLAAGKSVCWFALSQALDACLISGALLVCYKKTGSRRLEVSAGLGRRMLSKSRYYIVSGLMVNVFQLTDRVMLKVMIGNEVTGYYSAAVACAGISSFVFLAVIDSARPGILRSKMQDQGRFEQSVSDLYSIVLYLSLVQSIAITLLAKYLVPFLYGAAYLQTVPVLRLVVWYTTFAYVGTVRNIWILAEGKQHLLWRINLFGALTNLVLNLLLIPHWGMMGAAAASLVTQMAANVLLSELMPQIRFNNRLLVRGLDPRRLWGLMGQLRRSKN